MKVLEKLGIGIIDRYIMKKYLQTFFYSVLLFTLIAILIDISEKTDDFIKNKPPLKVLIFDYYIYFIPYFMGLFSPVFLFLSIIFFNSKQAQNTEIIAVLGSGASYFRFLRPYLLSASLLFVLFIWLNTQILPLCDRYRLKFEDDWIHEKKVTQSNHINYMMNDSTLLRLDSYNYNDSLGFNLSLDAYEDNKLHRRLTASRMIWLRDKGLWRFESYQQRVYLSEGEYVSRGAILDTFLKIRPEEFVVKSNYVSSMTNPELNEYIRQETEKGSANVPKYKVELYKRIAVPVSFFILTLLAVSVSSRKSRGGTGFHLGVGIFLMFMYLLLIQIFNTTGNTGVINPGLAVWIPPIVFLIISLILARNAPK